MDKAVLNTVVTMFSFLLGKFLGVESLCPCGTWVFSLTRN